MATVFVIFICSVAQAGSAIPHRMLGQWISVEAAVCARIDDDEAEGGAEVIEITNTYFRNAEMTCDFKTVRRMTETAVATSSECSTDGSKVDVEVVKLGLKGGYLYVTIGEPGAWDIAKYKRCESG